LVHIAIESSKKFQQTDMIRAVVPKLFGLRTPFAVKYFSRTPWQRTPWQPNTKDI